jgi:DNA-binding NarL/FixJ family response regulator
MQSIYIIDDDETYVKILTQYLKDQFEVKVFHNAEDALPEIENEETEPGFVIIDYFLPGMNGLELFNILSDRMDIGKLIVLSSNDDAKVVLDMIRQGVRNYVIKDEQVIESLQAAIDGEEDFI